MDEANTIKPVSIWGFPVVFTDEIAPTIEVGEYANVVITHLGGNQYKTRWEGADNAPLLVSGDFLRAGMMELLWKYQPFEKLGEVGRDVFAFRRIL